MYEDNDVLAQVLEQAREDLGENPKGLPDKPPDRGRLDIEAVRDAEYDVRLSEFNRPQSIGLGSLSASGSIDLSTAAHRVG
jgi:hypothetical protein